MKLFQSLLVAPAALGLLAPMTVTANELNINDVSDYSSSEEIENINEFNSAKELAITTSRVDGLEARLNNFEAGSFSSTTSASFSADFAIGAVDGAGLTSATGVSLVTDGDEELQAGYGFQIDLNTSFTGQDSLDISLDAGNAQGAISEFDLNGAHDPGGTDVLSVDGVSYTFPLGDKTTVIIGDNTDGSALFTTACAYGGPSNTLDDCGNVNAGITNGGAMIGASYDFGSGFTAAVGYAGNETSLMTKEGVDAYGANVAYTADSYGVSLTYGQLERLATEDNYTAINAYYLFDNGMSVSGGYETGTLGEKAANVDETRAYFVGVEFGEVGPGTFGAAAGTKGSITEVAGDITEEMMYEAYYSYPVNDGMTITPLVYVKENATTGVPDETGLMVKTSFSF